MAEGAGAVCAASVEASATSVDGPDPNPYKSVSANGKLYAWTKGMPSRPFMYNTAKKIEEYIRALNGGSHA